MFQKEMSAFMNNQDLEKRSPMDFKRVPPPL